MRQIILDTETTGLDPALGHRIIEIAAVEVMNRRITNSHFHRYLNPERDSEEAALRVHGLTSEFLSDKPKFREVAREFVEFINGAELILHNAAFDIAFIDHELSLLDLTPVMSCCCGVVDTLKLAREMHPGKRNALDSLCERYQINNSARTLHGALLDARLLAEVYLAMTRGQESLVMEEETLQITVTAVHVSRAHLKLAVLPASPEELDAHEDELQAIDKASAGACVWMTLRITPAQLAVAAQPVTVGIATSDQVRATVVSLERSRLTVPIDDAGKFEHVIGNKAIAKGDVVADAPRFWVPCV